MRHFLPLLLPVSLLTILNQPYIETESRRQATNEKDSYNSEELVNWMDDVEPFCPADVA